MIQIGIIKETNGADAIVEVRRRAACDGCAASRCLGCTNSTEVKAENCAGAAVGDTVELCGENHSLLPLCALLFLAPLALFFGGYALGAVLVLTEPLCMAFAFGGMLLALGALLVWARVRPPRTQIVISRIVAIAETENGKEDAT